MSIQIPDVAVYTIQLNHLRDKLSKQKTTLKEYNIPYPFKNHIDPLYQHLQQKNIHSKKSLKIRWKDIRFNGNFFIFKFTCESHFACKKKEYLFPFNETQNIYIVLPASKRSSFKMLRNKNNKFGSHYFNFQNKYFLYAQHFVVEDIFLCKSTEELHKYFKAKKIGKSWLIFYEYDDDDEGTGTDDDTKDDNTKDDNTKDNIKDNKIDQIKTRISDIHINVSLKEFLKVEINDETTIAQFLFDQSKFAGLGDYLVSEILHDFKTKNKNNEYSIPMKILTIDQKKSLYKSICEKLLQSFSLDGVQESYLDNEQGEYWQVYKIFDQKNATKIYLENYDQIFFV